MSYRVALQRATSVVSEIEAGSHPYFPKFFPNLDRPVGENQPSGIGVVLVRPKTPATSQSLCDCDGRQVQVAHGDILQILQTAFEEVRPST